MYHLTRKPLATVCIQKLKMSLKKKKKPFNVVVAAQQQQQQQSALS
jgi:hypothetical protein